MCMSEHRLRANFEVGVAWQSQSSLVGGDRIKCQVRRQVTKESKTGDHELRDRGALMIHFHFVCFSFKMFSFLYIDYVVYILNVVGTDLCNYMYIVFILFPLLQFLCENVIEVQQANTF